MNINFLGGKEQNQFLIELQPDSFQSFIRSFSSLSQDMQFEINRLASSESNSPSHVSKVEYTNSHSKGKEEVSDFTTSLHSSVFKEPVRTPIKKEVPRDPTVLFDESEDVPTAEEKLEESGTDFIFVDNENMNDVNAEPEEVVFPK